MASAMLMNLFANKLSIIGSGPDAILLGSLMAARALYKSLTKWRELRRLIESGDGGSRAEMENAATARWPYYTRYSLLATFHCFVFRAHPHFLLCFVKYTFYAQLFPHQENRGNERGVWVGGSGDRLHLHPFCRYLRRQSPAVNLYLLGTKTWAFA